MDTLTLTPGNPYTSANPLVIQLRSFQNVPSGTNIAVSFRAFIGSTTLNARASLDSNNNSLQTAILDSTTANWQTVEITGAPTVPGNSALVLSLNVWGEGTMVTDLQELQVIF